MIRLFLGLCIAICWCGSAKARELPETPIAKRSPVEIVLALGDTGVAFADISYTQSHKNLHGFHENDPFARPLIRHAGIAYAAGGLEVFGAAWLGQRMRNSQRWHRVWWLPQTVAIAGHTIGLATSTGWGKRK